VSNRLALREALDAAHRRRGCREQEARGRYATMTSSDDPWRQRVRYTAAEPTSWLTHAVTVEAGRWQTLPARFLAIPEVVRALMPCLPSG